MATVFRYSTTTTTERMQHCFAPISLVFRYLSVSLGSQRPILKPQSTARDPCLLHACHPKCPPLSIISMCLSPRSPFRHAMRLLSLSLSLFALSPLGEGAPPVAGPPAPHRCRCRRRRHLRRRASPPAAAAAAAACLARAARPTRAAPPGAAAGGAAAAGAAAGARRGVGGTGRAAAARGGVRLRPAAGRAAER